MILPDLENFLAGNTHTCTLICLGVHVCTYPFVIMFVNELYYVYNCVVAL